MADFNLAIPIILKAEGDGEISDDPHDPGGLTRWGISQRSYPHLDIRNLTRADATNIYRTQWWPADYNQINSQEIATKLLSLAIVMGQIEATICLQRAVRSASGKILALDGLLGFNTMTAINQCNPDMLLAAFRSEGAARFRSINNPVDQNGWAERAYS